MKLIKTISTIAILLAVSLSSWAQEPLKVAKGVHYPFKVDVVNKVLTGNYYFYWSLNYNDAGKIKECWSKSAVNKSEVFINFGVPEIANLGNNKLELQVSTKRENMCISNISKLDIEIIDKPELKFLQDDLGLHCSPSEHLAIEQLDLIVLLEGYWGNWKIHYKVYEEGRERVIEDHYLEVKDNDRKNFSITLDDKYRNDDEWLGNKKTYFVRIDEFEYMAPIQLGVKEPVVVDLDYIKGKIIAEFKVEPIQRIRIPLILKEINKK